MATGHSYAGQGLMMTRRKRPRSVVAWQSKAEWDQVMVGLYCGDCQMQRDALDRVSAWKSRYGPRMPLAVECTADLIRCKILDASGGLKSHELVLAYGLALVRFVNLITERKQKIFIIPLRRLAKELNIPIWIVNLRHELTHGKLPQLVACQKGCDVVLEWLRRTYWSRQLGNNLVGEESEDEDNGESPASDTEAGMKNGRGGENERTQPPGCRKHQELHEKVTDILVAYKQQQLGVLHQLQDVGLSCKVWCNTSSSGDWIVAQIKDLLQENREVVIGAFLEDGFLIPTAEDLQILSIGCQGIREWDFQIPRTFLRFWQPLLKSLHSREFTQSLLEKMFAELQPCAQNLEHRSRYLINWITEILKATMKAKSKRSAKRCKNRKEVSPELFLLHPVSLQWLKLLHSCLETPCWASPHLLHLILSKMEPPLTPETQEKLLYLTSIYTQEDCSMASPGSALEQPIYTLESLQWKVKQSGATRSLDKRARRREVLCDGLDEEAGEEEEEEEEEEEMEMQPQPLQEFSHPENSIALAEKRAALQGSAWQLSSDGVKWNEFPLGKLPGQTDNPDGLLAENYTMVSALDQMLNGDRGRSPGTTSSEWNSSVAEGLLWTQSDLHKLKSGLQLF